MQLELRAITKAYPGVVANDAVDLAVARGEIHALLGENGAGKSTLMKILFGLVQPDQGQILINGNAVRLGSPNQAKAMGLGMVQQHFALFEGMSVLENIALGLGNAAADSNLRGRAVELAERYGLAIDPDALVFTLSAGEKQRIEIVRTMLADPDILILDEPTSVLTPLETEQLFTAIEKLKDAGKSVVFITHKLDEVQRLCTNATILRRGKVIGTCDPRMTSPADIGTMMLGQTIVMNQRVQSNEARPVLLEATDIDDNVDGLPIKIETLSIARGDILGVAGVAGNGQDELYRVLSGEHRLTGSGQLHFNGESITRLSPNARRQLGCAFVPEERLGHSAVPHLSLNDNALLTNLIDASLTKYGLINRPAQRSTAQTISDTFDVRHAGTNKSAKSLSGGNLQKFVVGRELLKNPKLIVINQPTWGVDLGAAKRIRDEMVRLAEQGSAVLVISQDLDELLGLCDRLAVLNKGRLGPAKPIGEWTVERLSHAMLGEAETPGT